MSGFVVDASVAIKWIVAEEGSAEALAVRRSGPICAPQLIIAEFANVLRSKVRAGEFDSDDVSEASSLLIESGLSFEPMEQLLEPALRIALDLGHPAYDCFYLALAVERRFRLVTADGRLLRRIGQSDGSRYAEAVIALADIRPS